RASERIPRDELEYRAGFLCLELVLVEVAVHLVADRVELVEHLALPAVEQVRADGADREAVAEALLEEDFEVGAVGRGYLLADHPAVGGTLLTVGRAEGDTRPGQVLDHAEVVDHVRLVVESPLAERVGHLAVEQREISEYPGVGQAEETEIGREVELDPVDLAVADIPRLEDERHYILVFPVLRGTGARVR